MTFVTIFLVTKVPGTETEAQHTQNKNTTSTKKDSIINTSLELKCEECGKVFKHHTSLEHDVMPNSREKVLFINMRDRYMI